MNNEFDKTEKEWIESRKSKSASKIYPKFWNVLRDLSGYKQAQKSSRKEWRT